MQLHNYTKYNLAQNKSILNWQLHAVSNSQDFEQGNGTEM